jgi:hypothetical protein
VPRNSRNEDKKGGAGMNDLTKASKNQMEMIAEGLMSECKRRNGGACGHGMSWSWNMGGDFWEVRPCKLKYCPLVEDMIADWRAWTPNADKNKKKRKG